MNEVFDAFTQQLFIRATHPDAYRSGQWAKVVKTAFKPERFGERPQPARPVYEIEFVDGKIDQWPVYDEVAGYEFAAQVKP